METQTQPQTTHSRKDRRSPVPRGRAPPGGQRSGKHRASAESNTLDEQCHSRKVFIGGLAHKTTTQHLRDHFCRFGHIVDAVVLRWPDGRSRGFGYVTFAESVSAAGVLKEAPHVLSGREVEVKRAVPGTNKLFVGGLPQNTTANELREQFEKFGVVSDAVVMIDPVTSRSRGFGFVCFLPGPEGASAVVSSLQQYDNHRIRGKWIEVKSAAPPHKLAAKNVPVSAEELALAGAVQSECGSASSSISVENWEPNERRGDAPKLGSPRKVQIGQMELPGNSNPSNPWKAPPPGLAPMSLNDLSNSQLPWWGAQQWAQPFAPGFGQVPPYAGPGWNHGLGDGYFGATTSVDRSGLSESLQRNLELLLRQSTQDKMAWEGSAPRDPSVSTTCSAVTQI